MTTTPERNYWRSRIKALMNERRLSQADLAPVFGVSRASVSHYLTGRNEPTIQQIAAIAQYFQVSLDYLISGREKAAFVVPVLEWSQIYTYIKKENGDSRTTPMDYISCPRQNCSRRTYAIEVQGDSMAGVGGYYHGDLIFVDPDEHPVHESDVIVRLIDQRILFRRLSIHEDASMYLRSINHNLPLETISFQIVANILGAVVFSGRERVKPNTTVRLPALRTTTYSAD